MILVIVAQSQARQFWWSDQYLLESKSSTVIAVSGSQQLLNSLQMLSFFEKNPLLTYYISDFKLKVHTSLASFADILLYEA